MMSNENSASSTKKTFYCPHCGICSNHVWHDISVNNKNRPPYSNDVDTLETKEPSLQRIKPKYSGSARAHSQTINNVFMSLCDACNEYCIWLGRDIIYPENIPVVLPNNDLDDHISDIFNEARAIFPKSPKGSAALLRLCIQHLCIQLGLEGKNIDQDIKLLVSKGLPQQIQQSLDIVRVIGNEAVHPGVIDLSDDKEMALSLFELVNYIADEMITRPKKISELYNRLPANKLEGIKNRDKV